MTTIESLGEFAVIDLFRGSFPGAGGSLRLGIGDDASIIAPERDRELAVSCDLLVEGIHFDPSHIPAADLGYKALAVNLSDLAAMGAEPELAWLMLALPSGTEEPWLAELRRGLCECAREFAVNLAGGDTSRSAAGVFLGLTVAGWAERGRLVTRAGGRAGDRLLVSGELGAAAAGLELLRGRVELAEPVARQARQALLRPLPQVALGQQLASAGLARAMIDISDGLLQDLGHLCRASGCGARLEVERLPVAPAARQAAGQLKRDELALALAGGEDYQLLVAVAPEQVEPARRIALRLGRRLYEIGELEAEAGVRVLRAGSEVQLDAGGWDHFPSRDQEG